MTGEDHVDGPGDVEPSEAGWDALDRGDWTSAVALFDAALDARPERARALEGRAWAAWWTDDAATLFRVREAAYHAYRIEGDVIGAARCAIWLGCDHHEIRGEHAVANGWYAVAERLLRDRPACPEHAWLAFQHGAYAIELDDDAATAKRRAAEVAELADALGSADLRVLALALEGLALVTEGDVAEGMRRLDEASISATSGELRERIATTWTLCYLIYGCERVRDFARTAQWCGRMREVSERFGFDAGVGICRVHYGGVLLMHGQWAEAERELVRSQEVLARVRPVAVAEVGARLGELRRRQGREAEAEALLVRALPHPGATVSLARLHLARGSAGAAVALLADLVGSVPSASVTQLAEPLAVLAVAHAQLEHHDAARFALDRLGATATAVRNDAVHGLSEEAHGAVALVATEPGVAVRHLDRATAAYARGGMPYETAQARTQLAVALRELGQTVRADEELRRATAALAALGADGRGRQRAAGSVPPVPGLTARESEVLSLVAEGLRDRDIAERLTISHHTVHRHVSNILTKLGLPSRAAAAAHGARHQERSR